MHDKLIAMSACAITYPQLKAVVCNLNQSMGPLNCKGDILRLRVNLSAIGCVCVCGHVTTGVQSESHDELNIGHGTIFEPFSRQMRCVTVVTSTGT